MMDTLRRHLTTGHRAALLTAVLLAALLLRSLMPVGFMPGIGADGQLTIVICTADGAKSIAVDADGNALPSPAHGPASDHSGADDHAAAPCAFSALATLALPDLAALPVVVNVIASRATVVVRQQSPPRRIAGPPVGSQGPPRIS